MTDKRNASVTALHSEWERLPRPGRPAGTACLIVPRWPKSLLTKVWRSSAIPHSAPAWPPVCCAPAYLRRPVGTT